MINDDDKLIVGPFLQINFLLLNDLKIKINKYFYFEYKELAKN
jgi:hypothetical protein